MEPVRTEPLPVRINLDVGPYGAETAKCSALIARTSCANSASVTGVASPLAATQPPSVAHTQGWRFPSSSTKRAAESSAEYGNQPIDTTHSLSQ
jgi:hypothetical protein